MTSGDEGGTRMFTLTLLGAAVVVGACSTGAPSPRGPADPMPPIVDAVVQRSCEESFWSWGPPEAPPLTGTAAVWWDNTRFVVRLGSFPPDLRDGPVHYFWGCRGQDGEAQLVGTVSAPGEPDETTEREWLGSWFGLRLAVPGYLGPFPKQTCADPFEGSFPGSDAMLERIAQTTLSYLRRQGTAGQSAALAEGDTLIISGFRSNSASAWVLLNRGGRLLRVDFMRAGDCPGLCGLPGDYLVGGDWQLDDPNLPIARTRVDAIRAKGFRRQIVLE